jgi:glycosyltransferase involved in cell wall biosynthesis
VSRGPGGPTPRRIAVIGDMPHHLDAEGRIHGLEPVVAQLDRWAGLFEELVLCGPVLPGPPPSGFAPYTAPNVTMRELPRAGGNTLAAKLAMIPRIPVWAWKTRRVARSVDAVHLRCPCNIGMVAVFSTWKAVRYRYAIYAGVWRGYEGEPRFFRYQRLALRSPRFGGVVSVYAGPDPERPHLEPFYSPSFTAAEWSDAAPAVAASRASIAERPRTGPWRLVVVGRLTPNKNQQAAVAALAQVVAAGLDATLEVVGDGPRRAALEAQAAELGVADRVRFHGMVDLGAVLDTFDACDLQILSTRQEGYGKVLLEGMVHGVVPIFSTSPVSGEISGHGSRGIEVGADAPDEMAAAVVALVDDRERWLAMLDDGRAYTEGLTLEAFEGTVRELLERQWGVTLAPSGGTGSATGAGAGAGAGTGAGPA